jgi:hypothetical protein
MAINVIPVSTRLVLRLYTGDHPETSLPQYANRTMSNIKNTADNEDIFEFGEELAYLQIHSLEAVRKLSDVELVEE